MFQEIGLTMREAQKEDIPQLIDLMFQLGYEINPEEMESNLEVYCSNGFKSVVAELEGCIAGCVAFHVMPLFHCSRSHARIVSLVVNKRNRRQGIARQLIEYAESYARSLGCQAIEVTSGMHRKDSGTHDFYESQGYHTGYSAYFRKYLNR